MRSKIVERFAQVRHLPPKSHSRPKPPVSTDLKALVRTTDTFVDGPPEDDGTGVGDSISRYEIVLTFFKSVYAKIRLPSTGIQIVQVKVRETIQPIIVRNAP
jgi:hypothetical protein